MKLIKFLALVSLLACGKPVKFELRAPDGISLGPSFQQVATFCDNRYGRHTLEAEDCFYDYRTFYQIKIALDLDSITQYCQKYPTPEERLTCEENLLNLLKLNEPKKKEGVEDGQVE